ncbi:TDP-N-acetylfucosamine:lipid II N-acetylfucosaminyltransferase [Biostraticola tofi]|uniref:dTDP-N-acetylfucosamine:lipid II N-acetylfucosaminyltransferase n=1 Tax=Biostraticola tofi TaxID=466109 RepID=A0A4R3YN43_9GAMM|nr:TDP-N-acetylfucosamine:lipid II N-acetylfucosaminyltransferase [Biostraticola tofi]TCV93731.1 dTDP-N-acetylfucosamine:lipid II N-acetylfucosaminyltransferase [Biostraticola tofi]
MTLLIHVLGSDIPHHNLTVLRFFNETLAAVCPLDQTRHFMVVAADSSPFAAFERLTIERFTDKKSLARAVFRRAAADPSARFFLHGQFNPGLWLGLLTGKLEPERVAWHIWGADLYEESTRLKHRLFYQLRRRAQGKVGHVFATEGDRSVYRRRHPTVASSLLYFPTRMDAHLQYPPQEPPADDAMPIILVGNSGDPANRHGDALKAIYQQFGTEVKLVVPMGYPGGNQQYIEQVRTQAAAYFPVGQVDILTEQLAFADYLALLRRCSLGYFIFHRQQGIGTLSLLIRCGVPLVLSRQNPFWHDLAQQQVPVMFDTDPLDRAALAAARRQLQDLDTGKIAFFYPNYLQGWLRALTIAAGDGS